MTLSTDRNTINAFFQENGYYLAKGIYTAEEAGALESEFDAIVRQMSGHNEEVNARWSGPEMEKMGATAMEILHTHNVQQYSALWLQALQHQRLLDVAEAIAGPDIVLHHSKLFQKPPANGAPFPMHQDWTYFPTVNDTMFAGIIHVSAATDEMGCLRVYPGSHRLGRVQGTSGQQASEMLEKYPLEGATILEAEPGDVAFFHYFTLHGSRPNTSEHTRKTVLAQFYSGNDRVEDGCDHPDERLVLRGRNRLISRAMANAAK